MEFKHQKESIKWINNKLFISNTMDVILQDTSINTFNENESVIISTNNTSNYSIRALITDNKNNNNWTPKEKYKKKKKKK